MVAVACGLGGCSSSTSRFDFPSFGLTKSQPTPAADNSTTQSLPPLPADSAYESGSAGGKRYSENRSYGSDYESRGGAIAKSDLSPPASLTPVAYAPQSAPPTAPFSQGESSYAASGKGGTRQVTVAQGDTLFSIARRTGVSSASIMKANGMSSPSLRDGQKLTIPVGSGGATIAQASAATYTVKKGDTAFTIAKKHNVASKELLAYNGLKKTSTLALGQTIRIPASLAVAASEESAANSVSAVRVVRTTAVPGAEKDAPIRVATAATMIPLPSSNPARNRVALTKPDAGDAEKPAAKKNDASADQDSADIGETESVAKNDSLPEPEPMSGNSFRWPVRGRVISEYGSKPNGAHNDGINVAVPMGTSIKAAENGVVAYAGNELKGYGNLILIRHSNNWVSAYAHNDEILVKRGEKVRRGQIVGKAGKSGSVSQPQVHFELRKGSRPVDPTKYMSDA